MALPVLRSLEDCGDYSKTIEPFIPQLYDLPYRVVDRISAPSDLVHLYIETNPLITGFAASVVLGFVFLVVSEANRNYSQVDRMWSILPNLYIVHLAAWARLAGLPHSRIDLVATFSTLWSVRLTYNYWRKGGYNVGSEDYRWGILQSYVNSFVWTIFNITFISFIQSALLFSFSCVPAYAILLSTKFEEDVTTADLSYFAIEVALIASEWLSDGQMWKYQSAKYKYRDNQKVPDGFTKKDLDRGFITSGIFAYSRHPNFLAELTIWFVLYQWSCYATKNLYCWTGIGSGLLILLFQGSTWLTEKITAQKYPEYRAYKKQVGMFIPTSLWPYRPLGPKVIRTSELLERQKSKTKQK